MSKSKTPIRRKKKEERRKKKECRIKRRRKSKRKGKEKERSGVFKCLFVGLEIRGRMIYVSDRITVKKSKVGTYFFYTPYGRKFLELVDNLQDLPTYQSKVRIPLNPQFPQSTQSKRLTLIRTLRITTFRSF